MDEITVSDRLSITLGLRYDEYDSDDEPAKNADFEATYGFANAGIDGTNILNYRLGIDLAIDDVSDLNLVYGTYSSKFPTVWISNAYTNDGVRVSAYNDAYAPDGCNPLLAAGSGIPGCAQQAITDAPLTSAKIDFIAPSFEWPESKVLNVVYQRDLQNDWNFTATYLYAEQEEALYKIIDGSPLVGDQPQVPTLTALTEDLYTINRVIKHIKLVCTMIAVVKDKLHHLHLIKHLMMVMEDFLLAILTKA